MRIPRRRWIAAFRREPQEIGEEPGAFGVHFAEFGEHRFKLVEPGCRVILALETGGALKSGDERIERAITVLERAEMAQPDVRFVTEALLELGGQAGLADARLARQQHDLPFAGLRSPPAPQKQFTFFFPPDESGQAARVERLEPALDPTLAQRGPGSNGLGDALEVFQPEIPEFEEIAEEPSRPVGNDDPIRLRYPLQARRKVRRLADDAALLRLARADKIADHNQTRRDPDADMQGRTGRGDKFRHRFDDSKPGSNGALGVVLVRLGIAKIGEHAVAHILRDEPAVALD